jgi:CheY-like chemotaxis protein
MPGMNGLQLAERIRASADAATTILMLSSVGPRPDALNDPHVALSAALTKPVRPAELKRAILAALSHTPSEAPRTPVIIAPTRHGRRVLLAEDNPVNRRLARAILEKSGYAIVEAENGRLALDALAQTPFDIVLMDVQMPELDGLATSRAIRENEQATGGHIPIVALTAHALRADREACLAAGMDGYLSKPIRAKDLLALIDRLLGTTERGGGQSEEEAPIHAPAAPSQASAPEVFDPAELLQRTEGDRALVADMIDIFRVDAPRLVTELQGAFDRADADAVQRIAHTLKGSVGLFGAPQAASLAQAVETTARGGDLSSAGASVTALSRAVTDLQQALDAYLVKPTS